MKEYWQILEDEIKLQEKKRNVFAILVNTDNRMTSDG